MMPQSIISHAPLPPIVIPYSSYHEQTAKCAATAVGQAIPNIYQIFVTYTRKYLIVGPINKFIALQ